MTKQFLVYEKESNNSMRESQVYRKLQQFRVQEEAQPQQGTGERAPFLIVLQLLIPLIPALRLKMGIQTGMLIWFLEASMRL